MTIEHTVGFYFHFTLLQEVEMTREEEDVMDCDIRSPLLCSIAGEKKHEDGDGRNLELAVFGSINGFGGQLEGFGQDANEQTSMVLCLQHCKAGPLPIHYTARRLMSCLIFTEPLTVMVELS